MARTRTLKIRLWSDKRGHPRIQFKAGNGRILVDSEAYEGGKRKAEHAVDVIVDKIQAGEFEVVDDTASRARAGAAKR